MEAAHNNRRRMPKTLGLCAGVCLVTLLFLFYPEVISSGASAGLSLCAGILIPSLFPFMVLSSFALYSGADYPIVRLLGKGAVKLLRLPARSVSIFLFSLLGGYPIGPKLIASCVERGELDAHQAQRMLSFCSNAGPAFVVSAVGFGILGNVAAGLVLLGAQVLSALVIALGSSLFEKERPVYRQMKPPATPIGLSFVRSVTDSASSMMALCAFVVVFAVILRMLDGFGVFAALASLLHLDTAFVTAVVSGFPGGDLRLQGGSRMHRDGIHSALLPVYSIFRAVRPVSSALYSTTCGDPFRSLSAVQVPALRALNRICPAVFPTVSPGSRRLRAFPSPFGE